MQQGREKILTLAGPIYNYAASLISLQLQTCRIFAAKRLKVILGHRFALSGRVKCNFETKAMSKVSEKRRFQPPLLPFWLRAK